MNEGKNTRDVIVKKAYQLFKEHGYYHTSMADIGQACGLLKGSIYHYFSSKEDLMEQVLLATHELFRKEIFNLAYADSIPAKVRLQRMLSAIEHAYLQDKGGCLMGQTGSQVGHLIPSFIEIIRQFFKDWISAFAYLFKYQFEEKKAIELASWAVIEIEGAITLYCIFLDKSYFTPTLEHILQVLS